MLVATPQDRKNETANEEHRASCTHRIRELRLVAAVAPRSRELVGLLALDRDCDEEGETPENERDVL